MTFNYRIVLRCAYMKWVVINKYVSHQLQLTVSQDFINTKQKMTEFFLRNIRPDYHPQIPKIKFKTNFINCINAAFEKKGYQRTDGDDWDIIWSQKQFINQLYEKRLQPHQRINHFRNYFQLCRKDNLIRNLKKHKKNLEREAKQAEAQTYNFYPQTFILPSEYVIFADQFKKNLAQDQKRNIWIMKPTGKSQGKGIFLFNKLSQISQWENHSAQNYIVQKYIADPLLIGGKKFDMRIYALVTSYSPLTVYLYRSGFARFTHVRYDQTKINQSEMHLTNVAVQKNSDNYDQNLGGKWFIDKLKIYLSSKYGQDKTNLAFYKVQQIIVKTLEALQKVMSNDKTNSFELYGFDILFDSKLDPWLIQVNGSPSMTSNTPADYQLKMGLLEDTLLVIDMDKFLTGTQDQIGGFDLICKGKPNKTNQIYSQKISFLGTFNNRIDNLKKVAKNCGTRLNSEYAQKTDAQTKKLATTTNTHTQISSSQASKKSIGVTKRPPARPYNQNKDFIIKQKIRKQTNQNELR